MLERANFRVIEDSCGVYFGMFDGIERGQVFEIPSFPPGSTTMQFLMQECLGILSASPILRHSVSEARFLTTLRGEALISLNYDEPLTDEWLVHASTASAELGITIIGRSRKIKLVAGEKENVVEVLRVFDRTIKLVQTDRAFTQPNAVMCQRMLEWAVMVTNGSHDKDLLELYCGGGTFTAALATNFRKVLATELASLSVDLALETMEMNEITNVTIARMSAEDVSAAFAGEYHDNNCR